MSYRFYPKLQADFEALKPYLDLFWDYNNFVRSITHYSNEKKESNVRQYFFQIGLASPHAEKFINDLGFLVRNISWLKTSYRFPLKEIIANIQSTILKKNAKLILNNEQNKITNSFMVKIVFNTEFMDLKFIEQGEEFDFIEYSNKHPDFSAEIYQDKEINNRMEHHTIMINDKKEISWKESIGLGTTIIDKTVDYDYNIMKYYHINKKGEQELYAKIIHIRFENFNFK